MLSNLTHYWCHACKTDIYQHLPQTICGFCGSELIEEVEVSSSHPSSFIPEGLRATSSNPFPRNFINFQIIEFQLGPMTENSGLGDSFVSSLPEVEDSCEICVICQEEVKKGRRLNCSHDFHESCLRPWLLQKNTCPKCRKVCNK
jgi:E3 ubiquitin-protein ligase RNF115/126